MNKPKTQPEPLPQATGSAREACEITCPRCEMSGTAYILPPGCFVECKRCGHIMHDPGRDRLLQSRGCHTNAGVSVADSVQTGTGGVTAGETANLPNTQLTEPPETRTGSG